MDKFAEVGGRKQDMCDDILGTHAWNSQNWRKIQTINIIKVEHSEWAEEIIQIQK